MAIYKGPDVPHRTLRSIAVEKGDPKSFERKEDLIHSEEPQKFETLPPQVSPIAKPIDIPKPYK